MAIHFQTSFVDTAGTLLPDHVPSVGSGFTATSRNLVITSEFRAMSNDTSLACECIITDSLPSADYEVLGNIHFKTVNGRIGLWARRNTSTSGSGYMIRYNGGNWQLVRWDSGTAVPLQEVAATVSADTDYEMKIRVSGSTITIFVDGSEIASVTDTTYTGIGTAGIYSHGDGGTPTETTRAHLSDFTVQDIPTGTQEYERTVPTSLAASALGTLDRSVPTSLAAQAANVARTIQTGLALDAGNPQILRPNEDISIGLWTTQTGSSTNLFSVINEETPSDAEYIQSAINPENDEIVLGLTDGQELLYDFPYALSFRAYKDQAGGNQIDLLVELLEGTTVRATRSFVNISETPTTYTVYLEETETENISDLTNLRVRITASTPNSDPFEVSTGKMLNARYDVSSYTNDWIYVGHGNTFTHTYDEPTWGTQAHGKLLNGRMVQAAFEHEGGTGYPAAFDPQANTDAFIAALPDYKAFGLLAVTIGLQGGNPNYGNNGSNYEISAFASNGDLKIGNGTYTAPQAGTWGHRLKQILEATQALEMVCILNLFYHGQDQRLADNDAVRAACDNVVDFLVANNYRHVIIDIANEYDIGGSNPLGWQRSVLTNNGSGSVNGDSDEIAGLILRIQQRYTNHHSLAWRAPVGTSQAARPNERFKDNLKLYADIALPHGNVLDDWEDEEEDTYTHMVAMRSSIDSGGNPNIPIIMNEDANMQSSTNGYVNDTNKAAEEHALIDCMNANVSWGFMVDFYNQKYNLGLDTGWWSWSVGTAGISQASRTEADYLADVLTAIYNALAV